MSYLPYDDRHRGVWTSSLGLSVLAHVGFGFLLLSSSVPFLPDLAYRPEAEENFSIVSIDVLKPVQVLEPEAISELDEVLDETSVLAPETLDSLQPEEIGTDLQAGVIDQSIPETLEPEALPAETAPESFNDIAALKESLPDSPELLTGVTLEPDSLGPEAIVADIAEDLLAVKPQTLADLKDVSPQEIALAVPVSAPDIVEPDRLALVPQDLQPEEPVQAMPIAPQDFLLEDDNFALSEANPLAAVSAPGGFGETLAPSDIFVTDVVDMVVLEPEVVLTPDVLEPDRLDEPDPAAEIADEQLALLEPQATLPTYLQDGAPQGDAVVPPAEQSPAGQPEVKRPAVIANPTAQMRGLGQLIQQIRAVPQPECSLLLPRRSGSAGLGLSLVGADDVALQALADQVTSRVDAAVVRRLDIIDSRQCAALDALRQSASYPASRIGLALENSTLQSGDSLKARVLGAGGLNVALLLVDDNGVVQDLTRFATLDGDVVVIDAPVARSGGGRTTQQMLVVLGGRAGDFALADQMGGLAQDVFSSLSAEVLQAAVFGMATFQVE